MSTLNIKCHRLIKAARLQSLQPPLTQHGRHKCAVLQSKNERGDCYVILGLSPLVSPPCRRYAMLQQRYVGNLCISANGCVRNGTPLDMHGLRMTMVWFFPISVYAACIGLHSLLFELSIPPTWQRALRCVTASQPPTGNDSNRLDFTKNTYIRRPNYVILHI